MIIIKHSDALSEIINSQRLLGRSVGFVPTMGALHAGHATLIKRALEDSDTVICSVFVNPTQFNDPGDFNKYPKTIEADIRLLEAASADILFLPGVDELYPEGIQNLEKYDLGELENELEGKFRPGHFQGVCQVMNRLLSRVNPDFLFMGEKDFQQCMVVSRLIKLEDMSARLVRVPTVREEGGLALSSRNSRLSAEEKNKAMQINKELRNLASSVNTDSLTVARQLTIANLERYGIRVEYVEVADASTLQLLTNWSDTGQMVVLFAGFVGAVRLIDNMLITR